MTSPVDGHVKLVGAAKMGAEAGEAFPTLVAQNTQPATVHEAEQPLPRGFSWHGLGSGGEPFTTVEPALMCTAQLPTLLRLLHAPVSHAAASLLYKRHTTTT